MATPSKQSSAQIYAEQARSAADAEQRIQAGMDRSDAAASPPKSAAPQTGARIYPVPPFPTQHQLKPGDEAVATARDLTITRKSDKQLESELGWQRGVLVFQRATLVDVAREYNRYNSRKIVIADSKAGARLITATLPTNDVASFARMARNFLGLHVEEREGEIVISH